MTNPDDKRPQKSPADVKVETLDTLKPDEAMIVSAQSDGSHRAVKITGIGVEKSPAEVAAEEIWDLFESGDKFTEQATIALINKAFAEERAEHAETLERHDRMAAFVKLVANHTSSWKRRLVELNLIDEKGYFGYEVKPEITEAAKRYEEREKHDES